MGVLSRLFLPRVKAEPIVVEQRAWVMVYEVPMDAGWQMVESHRDGEGFRVQILKMSRSDETLTLLAKDYTCDRQRSIAELVGRDWRITYAQILELVTRVDLASSQQLLMDRKVPALETIALGTVGPNEMQVRERYAYFGNHELIISAVGSRRGHERFHHDIDRWFAGVAFRPA